MTKTCKKYLRSLIVLVSKDFCGNGQLFSSMNRLHRPILPISYCYYFFRFPLFVAVYSFIYLLTISVMYIPKLFFGDAYQVAVPFLLKLFLNVAQFIVVFSICVPVYRLIMYPFKSTINNNCKIVFFRSFGPQQSIVARERVVPVLGCYGEVHTVGDRFFLSGVLPYETWYRSGCATAVMLRFFNPLFVFKTIRHYIRDITSEYNHAYVFDNNSWKEEVIELLKSADLVVVDVAHLTDNVLWEVEQSLNILPKGRVALISTGRLAGVCADRVIESLEFVEKARGLRVFQLSPIFSFRFHLFLRRTFRLL